MNEIIGDFWEEAYKDYDAIVCTTNSDIKANGKLVMGAGIAKDFAQRFPHLPDEWGKRAKANWHFQGYNVLVSIQHGSPHFVALQTKTHWRDSSSYVLVERSLKRLQLITWTLDWQKILMIRPGCGNGGLEWPLVKEIFEKNNFNKFYVINK